MSRYERRMFFEALVQLREDYANRDAEDASSCISVADVMALANRLLEMAPPAMSYGAASADSIPTDKETK
jgi:hypothetical protein